MDTKQLAVMKGISALIAGINPDNVDPATTAPYDVDLRKRVHRGLLKLSPEQHDGTRVAINEATSPEAVSSPADDKTVRREPWKLLVQGFVKISDREQPTDTAYVLKGQVEQRLAMLIERDGEGRGKHPGVYMLDGLISGITIGQGIVRGDSDGAGYAGFYIPVVVDLMTNLTKPFDLS